MPTEPTRPKQDRSRIVFRNSVLNLDKKFWIGIAIAAVVIAAAIVVNVVGLPKWIVGTLNGIFIVASAIIGLVLSPDPKPINHDETAYSSVQSLFDMKNNVAHAQALISEAATTSNTGIRNIQLVAAQDRLIQHDEYVARAVEDWNVVSPGVVERMVERRNAGLRRFKHLVEEGSTENVD